jgi:hypothetical protein
MVHIARTDDSHFHYFSIKGENCENTINTQNLEKKEPLEGHIEDSLWQNHSPRL